MAHHLIPSNATIKAIKPGDVRNRLADGAGLYLKLFVNGGSHGWRFDYSLNGRRNTLSLGTYPDTGLSLARKKAEEARKLASGGIDPTNVRKAARGAASLQRAAEQRAAAGLPPLDSFEAVAREWHTKNIPNWAASHSTKIIRRLELDVFPWIGSKPVHSIRPMELLTLLKRVEDRGAFHIQWPGSENRRCRGAASPRRQVDARLTRPRRTCDHPTKSLDQLYSLRGDHPARTKRMRFSSATSDAFRRKPQDWEQMAASRDARDLRVRTAAQCDATPAHPLKEHDPRRRGDCCVDGAEASAQSGYGNRRQGSSRSSARRSGSSPAPFAAEPGGASMRCARTPQFASANGKASPQRKAPGKDGAIKDTAWTLRFRPTVSTLLGNSDPPAPLE